MSCLTILLSPLNLLFFMIVTGLAIGRIRIKSISVGIAGILFATIFVGFLMNKLIPNESREIIANAQSTLKTFSKLGTALFVSVIGLQTGFSIKNDSDLSYSSFRKHSQKYQDLNSVTWHNGLHVDGWTDRWIRFHKNIQKKFHIQTVSQCFQKFGTRIILCGHRILNRIARYSV